MKHKTSLVLMEQLVMVLVFAMAAALCLGAFAASWRIDRETEDQTQGALLAQNAAELLKNGQDPRSLETGSYRLEIAGAASAVPGYLQQAVITVFRDDRAVYRLETGWQETAP